MPRDEDMVALMRARPIDTRVRYRINNNEWEWTTGTEFLDLWDTPFAGTIYIDRVVDDGPSRGLPVDHDATRDDC